ncbi:MAG: sel1 repeat family protein [Deltaproteobacteria bacterium]|jgi:TPR repeat protein|nr:sel1 repeat family protein [Deltaproteobacteria bacterium]
MAELKRVILDKLKTQATRHNLLCQTIADLFEEKQYLWSLDDPDLLSELAKESHQGDPVSQTIYGGLAILTLFAPSNEKTIYKFIKRAYERNNMAAAVVLGFCHQFGLLLAKEDRERAMAYAEEAIAGGIRGAELILAYFATFPPYLNVERAVELSARFAEDGNPNAMFRLFYIYYVTKREDLVSESQALFWLRKSAALNYPDAVISLAEFYLSGYLVVEDYAMAYKLYSKALEFDHLADEVYQKLGQLAWEGKGIPANRELAAIYFKKSCERGNIKGLYNYGVLLYEGDVVERDQEFGLKLILEAAKRGATLARAFFANALSNDSDFPQTSLPSDWLSQAEPEALNDATALYHLATLYDFGALVSVNRERSFKYYLAAAELGHGESMRRVAQKYYFGQGVRINLDEHYLWSLKAAEAGNGEAQLDIASMYLKARGNFERDPARADYWLEKARENGKREAYGFFGFYYILGDFEKRESKIIVGILTKGIELEDKDSYACFGYLCVEGDIVPRDLAKGVSYLEFAHGKKSLVASFLLGKAYYEGKFLPRDLRKAKAYFSDIPIDSPHYLEDALRLVEGNADELNAFLRL